VNVGFDLVPSLSGTFSVRDLETGEVMHPNGPELESVCQFVEPARLRARLLEEGEPLRLLDVGLGAASNGLAAWRTSEQRQQGRALEMLSFERTLEPLSLALSKPDAFGLAADECVTLRALMDGCAEGQRTRWSLRLGDLSEHLAKLPSASIDVVFWDPYSARSQPALWGVETFTALRRVCADGASVHTFSAATPVRVALLLAGFAVGFGPALGTKQKRSTIAATSLTQIQAPLDTAWLRSLSPSALPEDAPVNAVALLRDVPQFR
jgi:queuine tRNA-ribosyltransferase